MTPTQLEIARKSALLSDTPDQFVDAFLACASVARFDRGNTIQSQGDVAQCFFIVLEGWVKLFRITPNGYEAVVGVLSRGQSFNDGAALCDNGHGLCAEAASNCTVLQFDARQVLSAIRNEPELAMTILMNSVQQNAVLIGQVEQLKTLNGVQRLAHFLLNLCDNDAGSGIVALPYEKTLIAGLLGLKPESLSRAFSRLKLLGVTVRQSTATIGDIAALRDFASEDPAEAWVRAS